VLGRLGGAFRFEGWIKVRSFTDPEENLLDYDSWLMAEQDQWRAVKVIDARTTSKEILVKLEGIDSREAAMVLSGREIGVMRSELPQTQSGEHYWDDLVGLQAHSPDGALLGRIEQILDMPAHGVLQIRGERQHLVPLVKERIIAVDLAAGRITLDWMADWLD
jgi:16S rRNA processing protein RimM